MTQSAVARFEAGGTVPTLAVLARVAKALDAELTVRVGTRSDVA
jgi:transcriptional regulator with XRE-family HTH domain